MCVSTGQGLRVSVVQDELLAVSVCGEGCLCAW